MQAASLSCVLPVLSGACTKSRDFVTPVSHRPVRISLYVKNYEFVFLCIFAYLENCGHVSTVI